MGEDVALRTEFGRIRELPNVQIGDLSKVGGAEPGLDAFATHEPSHAPPGSGVTRAGRWMARPQLVGRCPSAVSTHSVG